MTLKFQSFAVAEILVSPEGSSWTIIFKICHFELS